ncbi:mediator of RNA polymerase II transcription subunit 17 [Physcia stellaris]|nr:mediator of RNA polymerase II transcription subunit 17 [Physcia stellaris]
MEPSPPEKAPLKKTVYTGTFISTPTLGSLKVLEDAAVGVDEAGVIRYVESDLECDSEGDGRECEAVVRGWGWDWGMWCGLEDWGRWRGRGGKGWFFPGFVDTHIHAPQYLNTGLFGTTTLLSWLSEYTFPLESSFSSLSRARHIYSRVIARTLAHGTTTAAYYATLHVPATNLLTTLCHTAGQRAKVGRVCMDNPTINPSFYRDESPLAALSATRATITHSAQLDPARELVEPIITPRFAPSCTSACLHQLGALAQHHDLPIQTHISENADEIALVRTLFPACASYTEVYATHALLTPRTVLGHAIHLSAAEKEMVKAHGAGVAHCPVSNSYLSSGLCPVRELLDMGINVGLGTDVSGGWSPSVLTAAREALGVSRVLAGVEGSKLRERRGLEGAESVVEGRGEEGIERLKLSVEEVLYLATVGGAKCLGLEQKVGLFEVGFEFDAQMIQCGDFSVEGDGVEVFDGDSVGSLSAGHDHPVELWGKESVREKLAKWVFCGDDRNVKKVWVKGRKVHERRGAES